MNWDRTDWIGNSDYIEDVEIFPIFSNLTHSHQEVMTTAPNGILCRNMVEAHKLTLQFYRTACRQLPQILNRQGHHYVTDMHKAKLNLAKWVRKGSNMREPYYVSLAIRTAYEFLYECSYCNFESGYYFKYLSQQPESFEGGQTIDVVGLNGLNLLDYNRFKNKSTFLRRFIKGTRPLL